MRYEAELERSAASLLERDRLAAEQSAGKQIFLLVDDLNMGLAGEKMWDADLEDLLKLGQANREFDPAHLVRVYEFFTDSAPDNCTAETAEFINATSNLRGEALMQKTLTLLGAAQGNPIEVVSR